MPSDRNAAYNDLPPLPPAETLETPEVLRRTIKAARVLGELKQAGDKLPNQSVLINAIPMLEAQVSSEIENIVTTSDELFRFAALEQGGTPAAKEALLYRRALNEGFRQLIKRPLNAQSATTICRTLRNADIGLRSMPGTKIVNPSTGDVLYSPPDPDRLRGLLKNWEDYLHDPNGPDPLIKMAVLHYQFEAIHPFTDGNGRTGRILNILYLIHEDLLRIPVLYLSRYILRNRSDYYRLLRGVTESREWEPWILYMLDAVAETARWTTDRINAIHALWEHTREFVQRHSWFYTRDLIDALFVQPYIRIGNLVDADIGTRQTVSSYLRHLSKYGIVSEIKMGRRNLYIHTKFRDLLLGENHEFEPYPL